MKCLCGYEQKPENLKTLKIHADDCLTNGFLHNLAVEPKVVWRNRELVLTDEPGEDEMVISTLSLPGGRKPSDLQVERVTARWSSKEEASPAKTVKKTAAPKKTRAKKK